MGMIIDADVFIAGEREIFDLAGWMESLGGETIQIAAITIAELWHGVERATGSQKLKRIEYLSKAMEPLPVLPYTKQTSLIHARLRAELEREGEMIGSYDLIVAALAVEHGVPVATFNVRHFSSIRGLQVVEPKWRTF
jgi:tRNA(fMet)-specific endonuclease VapC